MEEALSKLGLWVLVIALTAGLGLLSAFPIMWCWNYSVVPIWGLSMITWGQAWCLNFLSGFLIKSLLFDIKK